MDKNKLLLIASIIFGIIGFLHLLRSLFSWQLVIDNFSVPLYFSYAAVIVAGYLSWNMYNASKK
ncbi:MAG: hypothetical protein QF655_01325 [Candidatus Woesearchaeota archaeon]|jgi:hypothetical protein|nr:hypothetical protein [Candidatus Woesearchaeota archaeon]